MSKCIYLAGAIDHVSPEFATLWRRYAARKLEKVGYHILDPTAGKDLKAPSDYTPEHIVETDKAMIDRSDIILAEMSKVNIPYVGTSMEIHYAWERGKEIVVWGGPRGYWIRYHAAKIFMNLGEALQYLESEVIPC